MQTERRYISKGIKDIRRGRSRV